MELIKKHASEYGLNTCLAVIGPPRAHGTTRRITKSRVRRNTSTCESRYSRLSETILHSKALCRHTDIVVSCRNLKDRGCLIGEFVVRKLLRCWDLTLLRSIKKTKPSGPRQYLQSKSGGLNLVKDLKDPAPFQVWYTDFT